MTEFERPDWDRSPVTAIDTGDQRLTKFGWSRGSFAICEVEYVDNEAGPSGCVLLIHRASGFHLCPFGDFEAAASVAETIEPLANWESLLKPARTAADARELAFEVIGERWPPDYLWSDMWFDQSNVVLRPFKPNENTSAAAL